jgi:hypothetical protein
MFGETNCGQGRWLRILTSVLRMAALSPNCGDEVTGVRGVPKMDQTREDRIRERAYFIWTRESRPDGRDKVHWRLASEDIDRENMRLATSSPP